MFACGYIVFPRIVSWHDYMRCESLVLYYAQCKIIYVETLINMRSILSVRNMYVQIDVVISKIIDCYIDRTFICVIL